MSGETGRNMLRSPSVLIAVAAFLLGVTGLLTIISSRYDAIVQPDILLAKQAAFLATGMIVMFAASAVPFRVYRKYALWFGVVGMAFLLIIPLCGVRVHGMRGWLRFGAVSLQPSELMKAPFLLVLAVIMGRREGSEFRRFCLGALWTVVWMIPVVLQQDFGTAVVYFGTFVLLYFAVGGRAAYLPIPLSAGIVAAALFICRHPYAWRRLSGFLDPGGDPQGSGWHARQFEIAIARGHLFGVKLGGAIWSNYILPFPYNDSAFATLSETLGFTGGVLVCSALVLLASSLWRLSKKTTRRENRIFIIGVMLLLTLQGVIHISVNLCLLPATGLTMPLVSYGGSSLIGCFLMLGMAMSAGNEREAVSEKHNQEDAQCEA